MFDFLKGKSRETAQITSLSAPVSGETIALEDVPDAVFAEKMMGEGIAFQFEGDTVCAPCDGTVSMIAGTLHAFGITANNDAEILIHIGFDTVNLGGEGFTALVKQGTNVSKGTPIIRIDRTFMAQKGIVLTTPMVVTNSADFDLKIADKGMKVEAGIDEVIHFQKS